VESRINLASLGENGTSIIKAVAWLLDPVVLLTLGDRSPVFIQLLGPLAGWTAGVLGNLIEDRSGLGLP
jgi:hypothetical protein